MHVTYVAYMQRKESIRNQAEAAWQLTKNEKKYVSLLITLFDFILYQRVLIRRIVHDFNYIVEEGVIEIYRSPGSSTALDLMALKH